MAFNRRYRWWFLAVSGLLQLSFSVPSAAKEGENPFAEPTPAYLSQFRKGDGKVFVYERYDDEGKLVSRTKEPLGDVVVQDATHRVFGSHAVTLRGLKSCPSKMVLYNAIQTWPCVEAARDFMNRIYNKRAAVVLCKTLSLKPDEGPEPVSCFALVGGGIDALDVVNDDDAMVFLGFAGIANTNDGLLRRPDLVGSRDISIKMGLGDAE